MTVNNDKYFNELIKENRLLILKVCSMFYRDEASQKDLFQDICINIWKGLPGFKQKAEISTWLYRVALNTALSQRKKHLRNPLHYADEIGDTEEHLIPDPKDEKVKALYAAIAMLRPVEKAIILLYLEEKSYNEIAAIIGISSKNVSVKLVRIKRILENHVYEIVSRGGKK